MSALIVDVNAGSVTFHADNSRSANEVRLTCKIAQSHLETGMTPPALHCGMNDSVRLVKVGNFPPKWGNLSVPERIVNVKFATPNPTVRKDPKVIEGKRERRLARPVEKEIEGVSTIQHLGKTCSENRG